MKSSVQKITNFCAILVLGGTVLAGFIIEFLGGQVPCILCFLQRIALFGVAIGLYCNLAFGIKIRHYALSYFWALFGLFSSLWHIALNICKVPQSPPFFVLSHRMYTWAFIVFFSSLVGLTGFLLMVDKEEGLPAKKLESFAKVFLLVLLCIGVFSVFKKQGFRF